MKKIHTRTEKISLFDSNMLIMLVSFSSMSSVSGSRCMGQKTRTSQWAQYRLEPIVLPATLEKHWWSHNLGEPLRRRYAAAIHLCSQSNGAPWVTAADAERELPPQRGRAQVNLEGSSAGYGDGNKERTSSPRCPPLQ